MWSLHLRAEAVQQAVSVPDNPRTLLGHVVPHALTRAHDEVSAITQPPRTIHGEGWERLDVEGPEKGRGSTLRILLRGLGRGKEKAIVRTAERGRGQPRFKGNGHDMILGGGGRQASWKREKASLATKT